jgi:hypothetical protein
VTDGCVSTCSVLLLRASRVLFYIYIYIYIYIYMMMMMMMLNLV